MRHKHESPRVRPQIFLAENLGTFDRRAQGNITVPPPMVDRFDNLRLLPLQLALQFIHPAC